MKNIISKYRKSLLFGLLLFVAASVAAQTYQAENATYEGELSGGAVWLKNETDYVKFVVNAANAGNASVYVGVQSPYGDKVMNWQVNSKSGTAQTGEGTSEVSLGSFSFNQGNNTITITPNWTWFAVDYIRITGLSTSSGTGDNPSVTPTGSFQVSGTQLLDGNGNAFRIMGANLAYAWYKNYGYERQMEAMQRAGANAVRVALSDGGKYKKDTYQTLQGMITKAESLKMVLIPEIHDATGSDDAAALQAAADWFVEMKDALIGHESTVIINIVNEWMGSWNKHSNYAAGCKTAIQTLRNAGLKHCIMIDAAGWGQEVSSLTNKAQEIFDADPLKNIIFSIHMYGTAGAPGRVSSNINLMLNRNLAVCIGEFAWYHSDGDVDEDAIISTCKDKNVGWLAWSWWGNGSGLGYLDLVKDQYKENSYYTQSENGQSCDWGKKVMDAWRAQAQVCSVYTQTTDVESIETTENIETINNLSVYDLMGRRVADRTEGLTQGMYIIVGRQNDKIITKKIFIQ